MGVKFIGDLSLQDAEVLYTIGQKSSSILEFGCGGSTQIFSQCNPTTLYSLETDPLWVDVTSKRLQKVSGSPVTFIDQINKIPDTMFDLIFVDGVDYLRKQFAIDTWSKLQVGGVMIFHDTRRFQDFQNAAWVAQLYFNEISKIEVNAPGSDGKSSNMTILYKKQYEPYVNWNHVEGKPLHAYGDPNYEGDLI